MGGGMGGGMGGFGGGMGSSRSVAANGGPEVIRFRIDLQFLGNSVKFAEE
jgi:hypothetical protein